MAEKSSPAAFSEDCISAGVLSGADAASMPAKISLLVSRSLPTLRTIEKPLSQVAAGIFWPIICAMPLRLACHVLGRLPHKAAASALANEVLKLSNAATGESELTAALLPAPPETVSLAKLFVAENKSAAAATVVSLRASLMESLQLYSVDRP